MLFDTHAHYYDLKFDGEREKILDSMIENGVGYIINAGCDVKSTIQSIELSEKYDFVYASAGVHPNNDESFTEETFSKIKELAQHEKVFAIGEIGLDYHYGGNREKQKEAFSYQINMAKELKLPFVVHCRDATGDCIDILKAEYKGGGGVMYCFSESKETARIVLDMGLYVSIGGTVTFKNNVRTVEAVKYIPLESLVIETDAPYLSPVPHRGERNSSLYLHYVAKKIAQIKDIPTEEVINITTKNAKELFGIA